jgi:two-component system invasion response regulator UvrY
MKIVIIDKLPIVRSGIQILLREQFSNLAFTEFSSFNDFLAVDHGAVDIIVFGYSDTSHLTIGSYILKIKQLHTHTKMIVANGPNEMSVLKKYLKAGVSGYLSELAEAGEFNTCFLNVIKGRKFFNYALIPFMLDYFSSCTVPSSHITTRRVKNPSLGAREFQIAELLSKGNSSVDIAKTLNLKPSTVSTIKSIVFDKLNITNVIDLKKYIED